MIMLKTLSDKLLSFVRGTKLPLQLAWAAPVTLLCFAVYVLPCWLLGWYRLYGRVGNAYVFVHHDMPDWLLGLWRGFWGQSCGNTIVLKYAPGSSDDANRALAHELEHTRQVMTWGVLQPIMYTLSSLSAKMAGESHYKMNHFEIAARRAAGQKV